MTAQRQELHPFFNQPVVIVGRLKKESRVDLDCRNVCLRAIEVRPFVDDTAVRKLEAVRVHHGWIQLTGLEYPLDGLVPMICTSAMVSQYTRRNGSSDLGFSPFASVCLDFVVRQAVMKQTDGHARQFVSDQLDQIEQGRPFFSFQADPANLMMQLQLWVMDDLEPPLVRQRLAEMLASVGVPNSNSNQFFGMQRRDSPRIIGFG